LSGKLRSLIARANGYRFLNFDAAKDFSSKKGEEISTNWDREYLALLFNGNGFIAEYKTIFGRPKDDSNNKVVINGQTIELSTNTRLQIHDDFLLGPDVLLDKILEDKAENTIDRNTGAANPRHIERVIRGTKFRLNMTIDIYEHDDALKLLETLHLGINLLNHDYLGGLGSRGSGSVYISIDEVKKLEFSGGSINRSDYNDYLFNPS
jgi:CRISPR/Cas system CSM-associated protein Csm3 (group 7 of RAMP superfamily)